MIRLYEKSETSFLHNKTVLKDCLSVRIIERANDMYEAEMEYPINEVSKGIKEEMFFTAPTSWGTHEPFRIYKIFKNLFTYTIYGRHITDDLRANYIEDTRPTNTSGQLALNAILAGTQYPHPFTATSNIATLNSATYIRKNPIQAIMGADANSFLNRWGGEVKRTGYNIQIDSAIGVDRGFEIRLGKNLLGIEEDLDISSVITRVHPTYVTDNVVYELPEKYIDSPLISNYAHPRILELRVEIPDEIRELGTADIENYIRAYVSVFYSSGNDLPNINYKIDFTKLIPGTEYPDEYRYTHGILANMTHAEISALTHEQLNSVIERNVAILDQLQLYDTVTINVSSLDIALKAKVISTTWDALRGRYSEIELGNFKPSLVNQEVNLDQKLQEVISAVNNGEFAEKLKDINDKITSANGGYIVTRYNALGQPFEILAMDTQDLNTAVNVIRINQNGIGFSTSGYNGPFNVAITIDGQILAQYIVASSLDVISANLGTVTTGKLVSTDGTVTVDLDNKEIKVGASDEEVHSVLKFNGLEIRDGDKTVGSFGETGAVIPNADIAELRSPKVMQITSPGTYTVGTGGTFLTLQEAFDRLFIDGNRFLNDQVLLLVYGQHSGNINMPDIYGGTIIVRLMDGAKIYGSFIARNMYTALTIESGGTGRGYVDGVDDYPFQFARCFNVLVENLDLSGVTTGIFVNATNIVTRNLDFGTDKFYYGIVAERGSNALMINNRGRVTGNRAEVRNAIIYQQGEVPFGGLGDSILGGTIINTSITEANSSYSPPPVTSKTFISTFKTATFDSLYHGTSNVSTYYGASAAQNRWDSSVGWVDGRIRFGSEIYNFLNGGTGISIRMRLRRKNTSHGSSAAVMPAPYNHSASFPSGATRGGWTGWATVPSSLFTSGGATLTYYNGVQGSAGYAIWDAIEVEVTVTKNV